MNFFCKQYVFALRSRYNEWSTLGHVLLHVPPKIIEGYKKLEKKPFTRGEINLGGNFGEEPEEHCFYKKDLSLPEIVILPSAGMALNAFGTFSKIVEFVIKKSGLREKVIENESFWTIPKKSIDELIQLMIDRYFFDLLYVINYFLKERPEEGKSIYCYVFPNIQFTKIIETGVSYCLRIDYGLSFFPPTSPCM